MEWVMAALTAAQMLQNANAADRKRTLDAAGIRYSPWSGIKDLSFTDARPVDTAIQGYAGIQGMADKNTEAGFRNKLMQAQIDYLNNQTPAKMNMGGPVQSPVSPLEDNFYMQKSPWGALMNQRKF